MSLDEVIKELHYFQKWRRGANVEMPHPRIIGLAIDEAIRTLREVRREQVKVEQLEF